MSSTLRIGHALNRAIESVNMIVCFIESLIYKMFVVEIYFFLQCITMQYNSLHNKWETMKELASPSRVHMGHYQWKQLGFEAVLRICNEICFM